MHWGCRHKSTPVPRKRCQFIGLRQLQHLLRCAFCQGTYLGFNATPRIHLHLTQRASRDLISASLGHWSHSASMPRPHRLARPVGCRFCAKYLPRFVASPAACRPLTPARSTSPRRYTSRIGIQAYKCSFVARGRCMVCMGSERRSPNRGGSCDDHVRNHTEQSSARHR